MVFAGCPSLKMIGGSETSLPEGASSQLMAPGIGPSSG